MGREIASSPDFHPACLQISGLIRDSRPDSVDIRLPAHQLQPQPVVFSSFIVAEKNGSAVAGGYQYVNRAVVIEVPDCHATRWKRLPEHGPALRTHILENSAGILKQEQWLPIRELAVDLFNFVVGSSVCHQQVDRAIVVVVEELRSPSTHGT